MPDQQQVYAKLLRDTQKSLLAFENSQAGQILKLYDTSIQELEQQLSRMLNRYFRGEELNAADFARFRLDEQAARLITLKAQQLSDEVNADLHLAMIDTYRAAYDQMAYTFDQVTPPNYDVAYLLPTQDYIALLVAQPWNGSMFSQTIGRINTAMAQQIQQVLTDSMVAGDSVYDAGRKIRSIVGIGPDEKLATRPRAGAAKWRADMIARTEMIRSATLARDHLYRQNADLIKGEVWAAAPGWVPAPMGYPVCEECRWRDGKTRDEIEKAGIGRYNPNPPAHPHCRCMWVAKLKSWKELLGPQLGAGMEDLESLSDFEMKYYNPETEKITSMKVMPFDEWKAAQEVTV